MKNKLLLYGGLCQIIGFLCTLAFSLLKNVPPAPLTDFFQGFLLGLSVVAYITAIILFTGSLKNRARV